MQNSYKVEIWNRQEKDHAEHWNDSSFNSLFNKKDYERIECYIDSNGFIDDFSVCLDTLEKSQKKLHGIGLDIGAGSMWLTAYLLNKYATDINQIYAVDYSEHYVLTMGQHLLDYYKVRPDRVTLCLGSYYDIKLPSNSVDFIVMAQAFHHAENPDQLLKELHRVLKPGGFIIMIGELYIQKRKYFLCYINYLISVVVSSKWFPKKLYRFNSFKKYKKENLIEGFQRLYFPPDLQFGDHYYLKSQYEKFFKTNSYTYQNVKSNVKSNLSYVLFK